ncbi:MAG: dihydroneopterin aldolase [Sphingomonadaceae bacterium]
MSETPKLDGLVPRRLAPRGRRILLDELELKLDIGFHESEIGTPQRILVSVEIWLDEAAFATSDEPADAWDYDAMKQAIVTVATGRRFNLQETLAREIYDLVAARKGVAALRVRTSKPDIYPDCAGAGVELSSFDAPPSP